MVAALVLLHNQTLILTGCCSSVEGTETQGVKFDQVMFHTMCWCC